MAERPLRVLHLVSSLYRGSGVVQLLMGYQRHLDPDRVRFDYLSMKEVDDDVGGGLEELGSTLYRVPFRETGLPGQELRAFFGRHAGAWDILHCHPIYGSELVGRPARRSGVGHVVAHSHSTVYSDKPRSARRNALLAHAVGLCATDFAACSEGARVLHGKHGADARVVQNAIETDRFAFDPLARASVRGDLGVAEGCLLLGTLGRFCAQKNQLFLVRLAEDLQGKGMDFKLAIAGSGEREGALLDAVARSGVGERILLLGTRNDVPAVLSAFDAFLLPSLFEGMPVSAIEAQASGLPCLLSDRIDHGALLGPGELLPVDQGTHPWVEAVGALRAQGALERAQGVEMVRRSGFDVAVEAQRLMAWYESLMSR